MIRTALIILFFIVFFTVSLLIFVLLAIIGLFNKNLKDRMSFAIVRFALRTMIFISGTELTVKGKENIPTDTAVLYVGNHRSYYDIIIGYTQVLPLCGFVSKIEMKKAPILSNWMTRVHCLFLDRSDMKAGVQMINDGVNQLKNGISVFIFPEGTRAENDEAMKEFKEGSMKMAVKAGVPIVPVAFNNTSSIFENQFPRVKKAHAIMEFGKPIYTEGLSVEEKKHLGKRAHDEIYAMVMKNKEEV